MKSIEYINIINKLDNETRNQFLIYLIESQKEQEQDTSECDTISKK